MRSAASGLGAGAGEAGGTQQEAPPQEQHLQTFAADGMCGVTAATACIHTSRMLKMMAAVARMGKSYATYCA